MQLGVGSVMGMHISRNMNNDGDDEKLCRLSREGAHRVWIFLGGSTRLKADHLGSNSLCIIRIEHPFPPFIPLMPGVPLWHATVFLLRAAA